MTPPATIDGAEFRRIADGLVSGIKGSLDTMFMDSVERAEIALRYAATLADELARVRADAAMFQFLAVQNNDFHVEHWEHGTWKVLRGKRLKSAIEASLKDRT